MPKNIYIAHLKSYGFLHPGRERWRQVVKRCWDIIPGATLYGALSHVLIKLDCSQRDGAAESNCKSGQCSPCGYQRLLNLIKERKLRFSPLIPSKKGITTAVEYCRVAKEIKPNFITTPHAPIDRGRKTIYGDLLYGIVGHQPFQDYYGFIAEDTDNITESFFHQLQRAFRAFPFFSFGGRGKYSTVEGRIVKTITAAEFLKGMREAILEEKPWVSLLTPMIMNENDNWLLKTNNLETMVIPRPQRYRVWRTGLYADHGELKMYGRNLKENECQTESVFGFPEGSRFKVNVSDELLGQSFIEGMGNRDWTYLGWGQVIIDVR